MKPYRFIFFFFLFTTSIAYTQDEQVDSVGFDEIYEPVKLNFFEGNFSTFVPSGKFLQSVDQSRFYGFSVAYLRQLEKEKPAFIGLELYHTFMGTLSRTYSKAVDTEVIDVNGVMGSSALGLNLMGRYYRNLKIGPVEPFFELHFGGKWLYSYLSESGFFSTDESYDNFDFIDGDIVLTYGGAFGFQVYLSQNIYLSLKGSYQVANSAEFYKKIGDEINVFPLFPIDGFEIVNTTTNNFKIDIGFTFLY